MTADQLGAALLNYAPVISIDQDADGFVHGFSFVDSETNQTHSIRAKAVVNATGAFCDAVRKIDDPESKPMIAPSQGVHVVLDRWFLPGEAAIMVPHTRDGRVMFAIPWHDHTLIGTTDTEVETATLEPLPLESEIDFILETAGQYLARHPTRADIRSVFAGIRPLVKAAAGTHTASLSRDHTIAVSKTGLITIAGGKWTTYRKMAEDCVDHAATIGKLDEKPCVTRDLRIHGYHTDVKQFGELAVYGAAAADIQQLMQDDPAMASVLHEGLPINAAQIIWAVRHEMARTPDDVLARRTRVLVLNAKAAIDLAPAVAKLMAKELGQDPAWESRQIAEFTAMARGYLVQHD
jgi:glycerol-3-phosphate dehydrogenase